MEAQFRNHTFYVKAGSIKNAGNVKLYNLGNALMEKRVATDLHKKQFDKLGYFDCFQNLPVKGTLFTQRRRSRCTTNRTCSSAYSTHCAGPTSRPPTPRRTASRTS